MVLFDPTVFRHLPIVDAEDKLVGIVSHRDLYNLHTTLGFTEADLTSQIKGMVIKDIMTKNLVTTTPDEDLKSAAALMVDKHINALPVMQSDELVGIITTTDIMRAYIDV